MTPAEPQPEEGVAGAARNGGSSAPPPAPRDPKLWRKKLAAVVFATLCLEIGCYLAVFPWTRGIADFASFHPRWPNYLDAWYIRSAVSALGLLNLFIAAKEIVRLRRFAGK